MTQASNYKWNDLEKRNTAWVVTLLDGLGHELAAERVRLEKLPEPYEIEFFPSKGPFTRNTMYPLTDPWAAIVPDFPRKTVGSAALSRTSFGVKVKLVTPPSP